MFLVLIVNSIRILDCYTDPLGWKERLNAKEVSFDGSGLSSICKDVRDLDKLYCLILELGKGKFISFYVIFLYQ